jgi:nitrogen-specific signal transduction histidine kinase
LLLGVTGTIGVGILLIIVGTGQWISRAGATLEREFARDQLHALREVASDVEKDVDDIVDDLRFALRIVNAAPSDADVQWSLRAVLGTVRAYQVMVLADAAGHPGLRVTDPTRREALPAAIDAHLRQTLAAAVKDVQRRIHVSPSTVSGDRWYRVFALGLDLDRRTARFQVAALVVDSRQHLGKLRLAAADPETHLLVVGPDGQLARVSDQALVSALHGGKAARGGFATLLGRLRAGTIGTQRIEAKEAQQVGLGPSDLLAAHLPVRLPGGGHWGVATVVSLRRLQSHRQAIVLRTGLVAVAGALGLLALGAFVLIAGARGTMMRERLRHADEVARLNDRARKSIDHIPSGVMAVGEDDRVTSVNAALQRRIPELVPGTPLGEAFPRAAPGEAERLVQLVQAARAQARPESRLGQRLALHGDPGHFSLHAVPLEPPSADASVLLVIDDLTALKSLEAQLLRTEKLATVGTLSAGIAHEIGTPLSVVRGRTELVLSRLGADHPQASSLQVVIEQTDRVVRTLRGLLDYSRARALPTDHVHVAAVIDKVMDLLRFEAERRRQALRVEIAGALPPLRANGDELQQVLVNLVMNALDASEPASEVVLRARRDPTGPSRLLLEVRDSGVGIAADDLHRVFDPFFTTKKRGQGTGLGLFIVAEIVRNHGAEIAVESQPGQGTRVSLRWPAAEKEP